MARSTLSFSPLVVAVIVVAASVPGATQWFRKPIVPGEVELFFSPKGGATAAVVQEIDRAKKSVQVQAYSFTSPAIAKALVAAKRRGLEVQIILDKSQRSERYTEADFTAHAGIPTWIDEAHAIAHNKIMILDGETVITGSFNFTRAAEENNAENLLILHKCPELAARYVRNWGDHRKHSKPYDER